MALVKASTVKGFSGKIRKSCRAVGTYRPEFETAITRLAEYYVREAQLTQLYDDNGAMPIVKERGTGNEILNPILEEKDRLHRQILTLERELGLTPAALRRVNEAAMAEKKQVDPLSAAILSFRKGA